MNNFVYLKSLDISRPERVEKNLYFICTIFYLYFVVYKEMHNFVNENLLL